ncbi:adenosine receptor A2b-like [Asterias amurensis]|uniref:adenosine receptor A2b-like n=1 Tax=Asterias amurensis TaxID=7602 RepID=UPI003AB1A50B
MLLDNNSNMNSSLYHDDEESPKEDLTIFVYYIFGILLPMSLFICTGNLFVIAAVCRSSTTLLLQQTTNKFIASLAVADCLVGVSLVPVFYLGILAESLKTDFYFCLVIVIWIQVSCGISMLHVLCIAFDRFLAVIFPLVYHQLMTTRRSTVMIVTTWLVTSIVGLTPFMGWRRPVKTLHFCYIDQVLHFAYFFLSFMLTFAIPLVLMVILYAQIIIAARRNIRRINAIVEPTTAAKNNPSRSTRAINMKATKTTAIVVGAFLFCWLPIYIYNFTMEYLNFHRDPGSDTIRFPMIEAVLHTLAFANSGVNPIIYAYRYAEFRRNIKKVLKRALTCMVCWKEDGPPSSRTSRTLVNLDQITISPTTTTVQGGSPVQSNPMYVVQL